MKQDIQLKADRRIKRISGQVAGIQRMVAAERPCDEILQQVTAVRSALDQLGVLLLTEHLRTCVLHEDVEGAGDCCVEVPQSDRSARIQEALTRFLR